MSTEYLWFVGCYASALTIASLVAFTQRGQALILAGMRLLGRRLGLGAYGLLHTFGRDAGPVTRSASERAALAESYIESAEAQTLSSAGVTVWVLISGCVFTALCGVVISGFLPPFVVAGTLSYEAYSQISLLLIRINVVGALAMGMGLVWWLVRRTVRLNRSDGCSMARELVLATRGALLGPELTAEIATGAHPRVKGLLSDVTLYR